MSTSKVTKKRASKQEALEIKTVTNETSIVETVAAAAPAAAPAAAAGKKKGSKKPVKVVAVVTPNGIEGSFQVTQRRPLIVHLGIHSSDLDFNCAAAAAEPEPYDIAGNNMFANQQESEDNLPF